MNDYDNIRFVKAEAPPTFQKAKKIIEATGGKVNSEVVRAIVTDGLVADMAVWRGIAKAIETLRKEEREAT